MVGSDGNSCVERFTLAPNDAIEAIELLMTGGATGAMASVSMLFLSS